jgi:hypothetical protein
MRPFPKTVVIGAVFLCLCVPGLGCGSAGLAKKVDKTEEKRIDEFKTEVAAGTQAGEAFEPPQGQKKAAPKEGPQVKEGALVERKIIYKANLRVIVEDLDKARKELTGLVKKYEGITAGADLQGSSGTQRTGTWIIRIPVKHFDEFCAALLQFGVPESNTIRSQDVTEEFSDLQKWIGNNEKTEKRLQQHLDKSTKDLKEILEVEKEIARVQKETDQLQGRLQLLKDLTALTTVTLTLVERKGYIPPQTPTFATTVSHTFEGSVEALLQVGKGVVLLGVALAPWLPVIAVIAIPTWLVIKRLGRSKVEPAIAQPLPEPKPPGPESTR